MVGHAFKPHTAATPVKRALLSLSDKTGLPELAKALAGFGVELLSTGGTKKAIADMGLKVTDVADITGFPEIMDGRVKTLHPKVHGGLLGRRDAHADVMAEHGIEGIDLVIINLYPFAETVAKNPAYELAVENIDIGGPAMIRAASKNHDFVTVITDPADYLALQEELAENKGATSYAFRQRMAAKAFATTAKYDAMIADWFAGELDEAPQHLVLSASLGQTLRYGENPHQTAALYLDGSNRKGVATARQVQGKELSFNNLNDTDAAFELVAEFADKPAVAIIKHANPCGVAVGENLLEAYTNALRCDPVSAFGGIVALNGKLNAETAKAIVQVFTEVIIAPEADDEAVKIIEAKKNLRLLLTGGMPNVDDARVAVRSIAGGYLVQDQDIGRITQADLKVVTERQPTAQELEDMLFAFRVAKHVKSNAIVYVKNGATVGIGAGQMSRIDSSRIAAHKGGDMVKGSVVASDAFFPFADGLLAAADAGATAIIQPGGSVRDDEVIEAANKHNLAMVFTGMRHFRH